MDVPVHIIAEGLVQGVGFRWFVQRRAEALGIHGCVRNLPTGAVEIEAEASHAMLEEFIKEIRVGPRSAHVSNLQIEWKEHSAEKFSRFEIR